MSRIKSANHWYCQKKAETSGQNWGQFLVGLESWTWMCGFSLIYTLINLEGKTLSFSPTFNCNFTGVSSSQYSQSCCASRQRPKTKQKINRVSLSFDFLAQGKEVLSITYDASASHSHVPGPKGRFTGLSSPSCTFMADTPSNHRQGRKTPHGNSP